MTTQKIICCDFCKCAIMVDGAYEAKTKISISKMSGLTVTKLIKGEAMPFSIEGDYCSAVCLAKKIEEELSR